MNQILAPKEAQRISDFMQEFPNGILNKKETGVGATHLAITNNQAYIICVPTIELIENKMYQHSNLFGVYGSVSKDELDSYLQEVEIPKIMVTYNSLPKLVSWLENPYTTYRIMVDEYHSVLSDYSYRDEAIEGLLDESLRFSHKCFVSATPINPKYCPPQLDSLEQYEIIWDTPTKIKPYRYKTNKPFLAVSNIIKKSKSNNYKLITRATGKEEEVKECYFFINSVKAIVDILDNTELCDNEVKIICSDTERNRMLLKDWNISKVSDENKPFTFVTSKAFLGADFYSESGMVFVVSNVYKKNTLYDIATDIFQIAGRIRTKTNPFRNIIYHIYNTGASELTREEFDLNVEEKTKATELIIQGFNELSYVVQQASLKRYELDMNEDYVYYNKKTKKVEFNYLKRLNEEFEFSIVNETYNNGLGIRDSYVKAGFQVDTQQAYENLTGEFIENVTTMSFKNVLKEYIEIIDCKNSEDCNHDEEHLKQLEQLEPSIKLIVDTLGTSKIRTSNYIKKDLTSLVYSNSDEFKTAVKHAILTKFQYGKVYPSSYVKQEIQAIYKNLHAIKKAKATDLNEYFEIDKKKRRMNGINVDSIEILKLK